ncbi:hypothetical protein BGZ47_007639, partial [Haplosporangium gracile]
MKHLRRLKLNLANHGGPTSDIFNRGKRGDALVEILTSGTLQAVSFHQAEWFFTSDAVGLGKMVSQGQATFGFLHLSSPHFKVTFDRAYFEAQVGALPPPLKVAANSSRSAEMRVLHRFESLIHTLAMDDTTTDEKVVVLRNCVQQQSSKPRRLDVVRSPSQSAHKDQ